MFLIYNIWLFVFCVATILILRILKSLHYWIYTYDYSTLIKQSWDIKQRKLAHDTGAILVVVCLGVTVVLELGSLRKQ